MINKIKKVSILSKWQTILVILVFNFYCSASFAVTIKGVEKISNIVLSAYNGDLQVSCPLMTNDFGFVVQDNWSGSITPKLTVTAKNDSFSIFSPASISVDAKLEFKVVTSLGYETSIKGTGGCSVSTTNAQNLPVSPVGTTLFNSETDGGISCNPPSITYTALTADQLNQNFDCSFGATPSVPVPSISFNSSSVTIQLATGSFIGKSADWWVVAATPWGHWYYYVYPNKWIDAGTDLSGISSAYQGQLFDLPSFELIKTLGLPKGIYTFYFGVDMKLNNLLDLDQLYYNKVDVNVQ